MIISNSITLHPDDEVNISLYSKDEVGEDKDRGVIRIEHQSLIFIDSIEAADKLMKAVVKVRRHIKDGYHETTNQGDGLD
jgi:hypothetical protein